MKKTIPSIIIAVFLLTMILTVDSGVSAESIDELKDQIRQHEDEKSNLEEKRNNLGDDKRETQSKIEDNKSEQQTVESEITDLEQQLNQTYDEISTKENEIKTTNEEIDELNERIDTLIEEIEVLEDKIAQRDALIRDRLRTIQQSGGKQNYFEVIFGAKSFADFISRATAVNTIMDQDVHIMQAQADDQQLLEGNKVEVEENKATVVAKKEDLETQKAELVALQNHLDKQREERQTLMAQLEEEQEELEEIKLSIEDEQAIVTAEESAQAQAIAMAQDRIGELEQLAREEEERKRKEEAERQRREAEERQRREAEERQRREAEERQRDEKEREHQEEEQVQQPREDDTEFSAPVNEGGIFTRPANGRMTSRYGTRTHPVYGVPRLHAGVDFSVAIGTPLKAPADGVVSTASARGGFGNVIMISHYINGQSYTTVSAHLSSMSVSPGQAVSEGQVIGATGNTGTSTGPHLHFEVHVGGYGNPVDPVPYLK